MKNILSEILNETATSLLEQVFQSGSDDDKALVEDLIAIAETEQGYKLLVEVLEYIEERDYEKIRRNVASEAGEGRAKKIDKSTEKKAKVALDLGGGRVVV